MGLFNRSKNEMIEQEVLQKMQNSELINRLIDIINYNPDVQWMMEGKQGESAWRKVIVKPSGFIIEIPGAYEGRDTNHYLAINFESSGYSRLAAHHNEKGKTDISLSNMCDLYARALKNRMKEVMRNCEFSGVCNGRDLDELSDDNFLYMLDLLSDKGVKAEFEYTVPMPKTSALF